MSPNHKVSLSEWFGKKGWVPFRLQSMATSEFIRTVNRILRDESLIVPFDRNARTLRRDQPL